MPNQKQLTILIDQPSWPQAKTPAEILRWQGAHTLNLDVAVLHTALWTRAPQFIGCDLSDSWAWLRYGQAFAGGGELRLRREWDEVSSQQKAVLSEEMGIGIATQWLSERLDFLLFVETKALVRLLGARLLKLGRTTKIGPKKAPAYIAVDAELSFSALECKANQSSLKELQQAIKTGIAQKQNLHPGEENRLKHSLVTGLFLPQARSKESATLQISDPTWEEILPLLREIPFRELMVAVVQLALAKHFALLGHHALANVLATADLLEQPDALATLRSKKRASPTLPLKRKGDGWHCEFALPLPAQALWQLQGNLFRDERAQAKRVVFTMNTATALAEELIRSRTPAETIFQLANQLEGQRWQANAHERGAQLISPLGFELALEYR